MISNVLNVQNIQTNSNQRLRVITDALLLENKMAFRKCRLTEDALFVLPQIIDKILEYNQEMHIVFVDTEITFEKVDRQKLWNIVDRKGYLHHLKFS